jgi:hypothetical protein
VYGVFLADHDNTLLYWRTSGWMTKDDTLVRCDLPTGRYDGELSIQGALCSLSYAADANFMAIGRADGTIEVFDVKELRWQSPVWRLARKFERDVVKKLR